MKKFLTLFVALALCMGLAVPALAVEYSYTSGGVTITVDAVNVETVTRNFGDGAEEITLVTIAPNTPFSVKCSDGGADVYGYTLLDDGSFSNDIYFVLSDGEGFREAFVIGGEKFDMIEIEGVYFVIGDGSAAPSKPVAPDAPGTYTVKKYDTYGKLALNYYGTYGVWKSLFNANKGVKLVEGVKLTLPEKLGKSVLLSAPVAAEGETLYTVVLGDTLGKIAKAAYGDSSLYKAIFERNADRLKNANTIYEGQIIVLPAK